MKYKTVVTDYHPTAKAMAEEVEELANKHSAEGWKLVSFSIAPSAKGVLVFEGEDEEN